MSWHFSRALEEEYSAACSSDGVPFAQWKLILTAPESLCSGKMKATFQRFPFGTMYVPSEVESGAALLTWYRAGFRAKTLALPAEAVDWMEPEAACGSSSPALLTKYDRYMLLWKTVPRLPAEDWTEFSGRWPYSGTMRSGAVWERTRLERPISVNGSGYWSTPTRRDYRSKSCSLENVKKRNAETRGKTLLWKIMYPTVRASDGERGGRGDLIQALRGNPNSHYKMWPTPTANRRSGLQNHGRNAILGGLNPLWVEWLMGWPIGWTVSRPLATGKFQQWLQRHGVSSRKG